MKNMYQSNCDKNILQVMFWEAQLKPAKRTPPNTSRTKSSNTQRTENKTTDVVTHQHSRKLLKMDILMSETCWAHNKWNKIASDIKLVFHLSLSVCLSVCLSICMHIFWELMNLFSYNERMANAMTKCKATLTVIYTRHFYLPTYMNN